MQQSPFLSADSRVPLFGSHHVATQLQKYSRNERNLYSLASAIFSLFGRIIFIGINAVVLKLCAVEIIVVFSVFTAGEGGEHNSCSLV